MEINEKTLISDVVAKNFRMAQVFKDYKIDFCCNGNRTIETAYKKENINDLLNDLKAIEETPNTDLDFNSFSLDFLSDYIVNTHHKTVEKKIPSIRAYLDKLCDVHGPSHPELFKIRDEFYASSEDLLAHMVKEENILFPYFKHLVETEKKGEKLTIESPLTTLEEVHNEHDNEGNRYRLIAELSNDYTPPADACTTYKVAYAELEAFEADLHKHIHLENNILFRKAIELENSLN